MSAERLQKLIAHAGITSRRKAEGLIEAGRVAVDGEVVTDLGTKADPERQQVTVDGEPLPRPPRVYVALHKPPGVVTSVRDPHADRVVLDLVGDDVDERVYPAGRLDLDSEGLVLLTNDGELMNAMLQPGGDVDKEYEVEVEGVVDEAALRRMRRGMELDGRQLLPCTVEPLGARPGETGGRRRDRIGRYRVVLHEGKKNQIRRMFRDAGHPVVRLVRRAIGPVELGGLPPGEYRRLRDEEVRALRRRAGLPAAPEGEGEGT